MRPRFAYHRNVDAEPDAEPDIAAVAALVGDPTRGRMLTALMSGRALTATELSLAGEVSPSTASSHLDKLTRAGLLAIASQGRHRYFRLAGPAVAAALEGLMALAPVGGGREPRRRPRDEALRRARLCYDHLAGEAGVRLLAEMRKRRLVRLSSDRVSLTADGEAWCRRLGLDLAALRSRRRPLCRACLDWSERRYHLAGGLGAALLDRLLASRLVSRPDPESRALLVSPRGEAFLAALEPSGAAGGQRVAAPLPGRSR